MSDLTQFLLARIAEDEERARTRIQHARTYRALLQNPHTLGQLIPGWYEWKSGVIEDDAERVLAECQAKRTIVRWFVDNTIPSNPDDYGYYALIDVMKQFAVVYADHPDYQEEWSVDE